MHACSEMGNLRNAMPHNISVKRIIGIVNALAKQCNFCMGESGQGEAISELLAGDCNNVITNAGGYV